MKTDPLIKKDLPEKTEKKQYCKLTLEQATLYESVKRDVLKRIEEESDNRNFEVLSALGKFKQVCNHPAHYLGDGSSLIGRSGKLDRITVLLEEVLAMKDAALVFTYYKKMGILLKKHFQDVFGQEVLFYHGGLSQTARDKIIKRFSEEDSPQILIITLKAGGRGINLTRASHVFHFDRWWNPAVENQATDRAFRIGQTKNVMVHKFICEGTLEERIDEMIESKKEFAENIIGTSESWLTKMTNERLRKLFELRSDAILDE